MHLQRPMTPDPDLLPSFSGLTIHSDSRAELEPRNDNLDDVFASSAPTESLDPPAQAHTHHPTTELSDVPRLRATHNTLGYRDGIAAAKASIAQAGFDEGFPLGAAIGLRAGRLVGIVEGISSAVGEMPGETRQKSGTSAGITDVSREKTRLELLLRDARRELGAQEVFSAEFWEPDGNWKFEVGEKDGDGEHEVVFADVAAAHPAIRKWEVIVMEEVKRWGVEMDIQHGSEEHANDEKRADEGERSEKAKRMGKRDALDW